ncbi:MAG: prenyltransferase [Bacteroidales bacterium]|nr:prenyltransferase [Candidatus Colimorpha onthohippi]
MKKHTLSDWVSATRYWSFSVSAFPVLAAIAYLYATRDASCINVFNAVLALVGAVVFHAAGNLLSDVGDYKTGADSKESFAVPNLVNHIFETREYIRFAVSLLVVGIAIGLFLTSRCGWSLLIIGVIGSLLTLCYTQTKFYLLSDLHIFLVFGVIILLGTSVAATGSICWDVLWLTVPLGFITLSVLHINNTRDIVTDQAVGIHTIASTMGARCAVVTYCVYQVLPFVWMVCCAVGGVLPWTSLLCLLGIIPAVQNVRQASRFKVEGNQAILMLDLSSAKLQLVFSLTLTAGLFLSLLVR